MKSIIKKVLKEEVNQKLKSKLLGMISSEGLVKTSRKVSGEENKIYEDLIDIIKKMYQNKIFELYEQIYN